MARPLLSTVAGYHCLQYKCLKAITPCGKKRSGHVRLGNAPVKCMLHASCTKRKSSCWHPSLHSCSFLRPTVSCVSIYSIHDKIFYLLG